VAARARKGKAPVRAGDRARAPAANCPGRSLHRRSVGQEPAATGARSGRVFRAGFGARDTRMDLRGIAGPAGGDTCATACISPSIKIPAFLKMLASDAETLSLEAQPQHLQAS